MHEYVVTDPIEVYIPHDVRTHVFGISLNHNLWEMGGFALSVCTAAPSLCFHARATVASHVSLPDAATVAQ